MRRVELKHIAIRPSNPMAGWQSKVHKTLLAAFVAVLLLVWMRLWGAFPLLAEARWPDALLLILAAATTLASLTRQLPAQNVVLAAVVAGLLAGAVQAVGALTAVPFGPIVYNEQNIGRFLFYPLPWSLPLIWVVIILNSRGAARLILRFRRGSPNYGFWVMGVTIVLIVLFDLSLEPYATQVREFWSWKPTKIHSNWYSTPWVNFLGWAVTSLLILLFVVPALINKSPVPSPPARDPVIVWELLSLLFLTGTSLHHLWLAAALTLCQMLVVAAASLLGGAKSRR